MRAILCFIALFAVIFAAEPQWEPPYQTTIPSVSELGIDTIYLDGPNDILSISQAWGTPELYIYGSGGIIRGVTVGDNFAAIPTEWWGEVFLNPTFINNTAGQVFAVGPVVPHFNSSCANNYEIPIGVTAGNANFQWGQQFCMGSGFIPLATHVSPNFAFPQLVSVYSVGYMPVGAYDNNLTGMASAFGLMRTVIDTTNMANGVTWDSPVNNVAVLNFVPFTSGVPTALNPQVYHTPNLLGGAVIVLDPIARMVFRVNATASLGLSGFGGVEQLNFFNHSLYYEVVSSAYDWNTSTLYVGLSSQLTQTGAIIGINCETMNVDVTIQMPENYTNPKVIIIDHEDQAMVVGFYGASSIVKFDLYTFNQIGSMSTPPHVHNVWSGLRNYDDGYYYFSTREQNSKIFRMQVTDFCDDTCGQFQVCSAGQCVCDPMWAEMNSDGVCVPINHHQPTPAPETKIVTKTNKGGETALGILFMLSFIAAAGGWYMYWKVTRGSRGYTSMK